MTSSASGVDPRQRLWRFVRARKYAYGISVLAIVISNIVMVQFPHILGRFTDALEAGTITGHSLWNYAFALFLVGTVYVLFYGVGQLRNGQLGRIFEYELRKELFLHWESLSTSYFRRRSIGDLLNHAMNDVRQVREALSGGVNTLANSVFLLITTLYMTLTTVSLKLTLVSIIPLLGLPFIIVKLGPRIREGSRRAQESLSDMAAITEESITAIRLVKATANEEVEARRFTEKVDTIVRKQMVVIRVIGLFQSMIPFTGSISFALALAYGGYLTAVREIPLGSFVAFTLYLAMLIQPLQQLGSVFNYFQRASASLERLEVLLGEQSDIQDPEHPVQLEQVHGRIRVSLPQFQYEDAATPVLQDVFFEVKSGQTLGVVGRTGSGKTTLLNLLPRLFNPAPGTIFVDDVDIRDLPLSTLRESIAYVPQDGFLFSTTLADNIAFGKTTASRGEIEEVANLASLTDDIQVLPDGLDTMIGERGVTLSGGQRQRAALARAFLKHAPILIMDDSLSAVDMNTEKRILEHLRQTRQNKTTVIAAHRLSAVRHADLIVVLEHGRIVERGTHEQLVQQGGIYASMYALQESGEEVLA